MPASVISSMIVYLFVTGITPGPANLCSLTTVLRHGKKTALRQWRGIFIGFFIVSLISGVLTYFIGEALVEYVKYFSFVGAAYILWFAYHVWKDDGSDEDADKASDEEESKARRFELKEGTFLFGVFVQLTNVKIMIMCVTVLACYVLPYDTSFLTLFIVSCLLPFTGPMCNMVWLQAGSKLQNLFSQHRKLLNIVMALSLVGCAISMVLQ